MKIIWLTGRYIDENSQVPYPSWEVLGVYSSQKRAIKRCTKESDFVLKLDFNTDFAEEGTYFPKENIQWPLWNLND